MKAELFTACDQLATSALNGIVEGVLIAIFVGLALRAIGAGNAATRHGIWFGTLLLLVLLVPAQWWSDQLGRNAPLIADQPAESKRPPLALVGQDEPESAGLTLSDPSILLDQDVSGRQESGKDEPLLTPTVPRVSLGQKAHGLLDGFLHSAFWKVEVKPALPQRAGAVLIGLWIAAAGGRLLLLLGRLRGLRQLKRHSVRASTELEYVFQRLRQKLGVTRKVELRMSRSQSSAVVIGFFHPVILFSLEEDVPPDLAAAELVLGHELAHVSRYDDWTNLLQQLIGAVLCVHPAIGWISKRLALEREIACDDVVLHQGGRPAPYARLLVDLAGRRTGPPPLLAPGVSIGKYQLEQRIAMILNADRNRSPRLAKGKLGFITAASAMVALLALFIGPRLVVAQSADPARSSAPDPRPQLAPDPQPNPAPAIAIEFAQADSAAGSSPANVDEGPKRKPSASIEEAPQATPAPPAKPRRPAEPRRPRPPQAAPAASMEERLDRLERMVQTLLDQQSVRHGHAGPAPGESGDSGQFSKRDFGNFNYNFDAKRDVARAAEMEKRALKDAERAAKMEEKMREIAPRQDGLAKELEALHQQRDVLQREMEKLQRQIERIARERERIDDVKRRHGDDDRDEPREDEAKRP